METINMKSTATTKGSSPLASWQQQPQAKHGVLHLMKGITAELESLQAVMHGYLTNAEGEYKKGLFFEDADAMQVLNNFKAELDQLRRILWFYVEETTVNPDLDLDQEQKNRRLQRITELLGALAPQPVVSAQGTGHDSGSFFERLNHVIDVHMRDKTPITQSSLSKRRKS
jgi:hypothetical protein